MDDLLTGRVADSNTETVETRFADLVNVLAKEPGVTHGAPDGAVSKKAFGSSALKVDNKIFAMISSRGSFVVKLPKQRVNELVASDDGEQFDPGHGRLMKEWVAISPTSQHDWTSLAREALAFVSPRH